MSSFAAILLGAPLLGAAPQSPKDAMPPREALVLYSAGIDAWLADPRDAGLRKLVHAVGGHLHAASRAAEGRDPESEAGALAYDLATRPLVMRVAAGDPSRPDSLRLQVSAVFPSVESATATEIAVARMFAAAGLEVRKGADGRRSVVTPAGTLVFGAERLDDRGALTLALGQRHTDPFTLPDTGLESSATPVFFAYYEPLAAGQILQPWVALSGPAAETTWRALEVAGLVGKNGASSFAVGIQNGRAVAVSRKAAVLDTGRPTLLDARPLEEQDFARLPADSTAAAIVQLRPLDLLFWLDETEDGAGLAVEKAVSQATKVDLVEDLLGLLGPTAGGFFSSGTGGGGLLSGALFIEAADTEAIADSVGRLEGWALDHAARRDVEVETLAFRHGDVECTTFRFPGLPLPIEPSYALAAGALWVATHPSALQAALDQLESERTVLDHPHLARLDRSRLAGVNGFWFFDAPFYAERGYATLTGLSSMLAGAAASFPAAAEVGPLAPSQRDLLAGSTAWFGWTWAQDHDLLQFAIYDRSLVSAVAAIAGTPLFQTGLGPGLVPLFSAVALPNLMSARLAANETAAIASLRAIAAAQEQIRSNAVIDTDTDGEGEYAYLGELGGGAPLRVASTGAPARGHYTLDPPYVSRALGEVVGAGHGRGVVTRGGYHFQMWLPGGASESGPGWVAESEIGGADPVPATEADGGERLWRCYAWPVDAGTTGNRAFVVDQTGWVRQFDNGAARYSGLDVTDGRAPTHGAAFGRSEADERWVPVE